MTPTAGMGAMRPLPMPDWADLITRRDIWVAHNFPSQTNEAGPIDSTLGVIEEVGELTHGFLKLKQQVRMNEDHVGNMRDAVGDITIYLLGVMSFFRFTELQVNLHRRTAEQAALDVASASGHLAEIINTGGSPHFAIHNLVEGLLSFCEAQDWNYADIVHDTWAQVEQRDWIKYPDTGRPPVAVEEFIDRRTVNQDDVRFRPIWDAIKGWDIERVKGQGYAPATGTDVQVIIDSLDKYPSTYVKPAPGQGGSATARIEPEPEGFSADGR